MDHGEIVTLTDPNDPSSQINLITHDETAPVATGSEIVHP